MLLSLRSEWSGRVVRCQMIIADIFNRGLKSKVRARTAQAGAKGGATL